MHYSYLIDLHQFLDFIRGVSHFMQGYNSLTLPPLTTTVQPCLAGWQ